MKRALVFSASCFALALAAMIMTGCNSSQSPTGPTAPGQPRLDITIGQSDPRTPAVVNRPGITSPTDAPTFVVDDKGEGPDRYAIELRWASQSLASNVKIRVYQYSVRNTWVLIGDYEETASLLLSRIEVGEGGIFKFELAYEFPDGVVSNWATDIHGIGNQTPAKVELPSPCKDYRGKGYKPCYTNSSK